jgi:hypothetical protein
MQLKYLFSVPNEAPVLRPAAKGNQGRLTKKDAGMDKCAGGLSNLSKPYATWFNQTDLYSIDDTSSSVGMS